MRVRINYAVEVSCLIGEVQRLIDQAEHKLHNQVGKLVRARDQFDELTMENVIKQIDLTRQELSRYDQTLEDCFSILQGYNGIIEREQDGDTNEQAQPEDG